MPALTIRHVTTYRYRRPVAFGEHRMMLRPRDAHDQKITYAQLGITPKPCKLRYDHDGFGNHVAIAEFIAKATELSFESIVAIEHTPSSLSDLACAADAPAFPVDYGNDIEPDLEDFRRRRHADPDDAIVGWARQFIDEAAAGGALALLIRLCRAVPQQLTYRRREAKGIQSPAETLRLGHGSCRDFAWLMIEAARALGLAARFASGYLAVDLEPPPEQGNSGPHGATHAWAQVYLPGMGWVDFDPTSGSVGKCALVTVAVVGDPQDALPLHGTFIGSASDPLGMEVRVSVTSGCN
ncbi:MAG: transglutaminase family protein [Enhydrobacter sp.]|nr:transglutaminase family protein [Enhydrobacter sp.]